VRGHRIERALRERHHPPGLRLAPGKVQRFRREAHELLPHGDRPAAQEVQRVEFEPEHLGLPQP
jgi:hypothetical protein